MSRDIINLGNSVNSGNGDPLRTAFQKVENNFGELYAHANSTDNPHNLTPTQIGAVSASILDQPGGVATLDGTGRLRYAQRPTYTYEDFVTGSVQTNLIPAGSATSLGNSTIPWQAAFIGNASVNTVTAADVVITNSITTSVPIISSSALVLTHAAANIASIVGTSLVIGSGNAPSATNSTILSSRASVVLSSNSGTNVLTWNNGALSMGPASIDLLGGIITMSANSIVLAANTTIADSLTVTDTTIEFNGEDLWHTGNFDPTLKLNNSAYTAADVLGKLITVDGAASGLDADLLDGQHGSFYLSWNNHTNKPTTLAGFGIVDGVASSEITASAILTKLLTVDGASSTLDADFLDGQHGAFYRSWNNQTDTPTTLSGYGITDAQPIDSTLTALSALSGTGLLVSDSPDTFDYRAIGVGSANSILDRGSADARYLTTDGPHTFTGLNTFSAGLEANNLTLENSLEDVYETTVWISNPSPATLVDPIRVSPSVRYSAAGWNTSLGASRSFDFFNEITPEDGEDAALTWRYSYHGDQPTTLMELRSGGSLYIANAMAWTTANMGSGSGLNADLLDGQSAAYYLDWDNITDVPTTLTGFGITDSQPLSSKLTAIAGLSSNVGFVVQTGASSYAIRSFQGIGTVEISNSTGGAADVSISVGAALDGLSSLSDDAGVVVSLGDLDFNILSIGAGSSSSILDRAAGDGRYLQNSGGTMTGALTLAFDPTNPLHAATKQYVDNSIEGISAKFAARVASTVTVNISSPGSTIDSVTLVSGDRILLKNQASLPQNGVYVFDTSSTALVRSSDLNAIEEFPGSFVFVEEGTINASTGWICTSDTGTLGTTDIVFVQFSGASNSYTAGLGLSMSGNELSVDGNLINLFQFSSNGILIHHSNGTFSSRTLTGPASGLTITNGDGLSGNPTIALADDLAALEALSGNGFAVRTGANAWAQRSIAVGTGLSITNADGQMASPSISLDPSIQNLLATSWVSGVQIPVLTNTNTWALRTIGSSSGFILDRAAGESLFVKLAGINTLQGSLTLRSGNTVAAPMAFQAGVLMTSPAAHSVEWDGINLHVTNDTNARKRIAYIDSNISGSAASATTADRWANARNLVITGDVESSMWVDGSINVLSNSTIQNGVVTNAKLANASAGTIKGAVTTGTPVDLTPTQAKTILSLENVENKSSTTLRNEITNLNVTSALGYTAANVAGDTFSGTIVLKGGTNLIAPMRFQTGSIMGSPTAHSVEWDGNTVHVTNSVGSRHEVQFRDDTLNWSRVVSTPTTLAGYGIVDAASSNAATTLANILTVDGTGSGLDADLLDGQHGSYYTDWANITNRSTTLAGYGISDAQPLDTGLTALAAADWTAGSQIPVFTALNAVTMTTIGSATGNILNKAAGDTLYLGILATAADSSLFNGQSASYYTTAGNLTGTVPVGTLPTNVQHFALLTPAIDATPYWINSTTMGTMTITSTARTLLDDTSTTNMRTTLGLAIGTNVQAYNAGLNSISLLTPTTDQMIYTTGANTYAITGLTTFGRSFIDDVDASAARTTLGVVIGTNVQAYNATLASVAASSWSSGVQVLTLTDTSTINLKTVGSSSGNILDKAAGDTLYQPLDATLTAIAGLNTTAGIVVQTGTDTFTKRSLAVGSGLSISDGAGTSGNPTISLDDGLLSISSLTGAGVLTATATDSFAMRAIGVSASTDILDRAAADTRYLQLSGGTLTNFVTLSADPPSNLHAATKQYVDNVAQGLSVKTACVAATTANISLTGAQTIDGVSVIAGNRVLVKNQTTQAENGIYIAASGAWVRSSDADTWLELRNAFTFVSGGTINGFTGWTSSSVMSGTLDTTAVSFVQFSGSASYTAANGIVLSGAEFSLTGQALALHNLGSSGIIARTGAGTVSARTITSASTGALTIADGAGVSGNPTLTVDAGLVSIAGLTGAGVVTATGTDTFAMRTIGVSGSTDIPDRAAADTRYPQLGAANTFTGNQTYSGVAPFLHFEETDQTNPSGHWRIIAAGGSLMFNRNTAAGGDFSTQSFDLYITSSGVALFATAPYVNSDVIWHAGNDGAGGGLDADLLDGQQGSFYQSAANLNAGTLLAARMPALTGDITTSAGAVATTLATVNSNVGSFGSATQAVALTVNAKGLITAASASTITPAWSSVTSKPTTLSGYSVTAADVLATLLTVDGASSALDADLLDGRHGSQFVMLGGTGTNADATMDSAFWTDNGQVGIAYISGGTNFPNSQTAGGAYTFKNFVGASNSAYSRAFQFFKGSGDTSLYMRGFDGSGVGNAWGKMWSSDNDGTGSTLDADLLDGQEGTFYQNATNLSAGTVAAGRMPALTGDITTSAGAVATTLATVNSNVGAFGNATHVGAFTVNAKGLTTAASAVAITPSWSSITSKPTTVSGFGITDAAALGVTNTFTAGQIINTGAATASLRLDAAAGQYKWLEMSTAGSRRWLIYTNNDAETGSSAGSTFIIGAYNDAGSFSAEALRIARATGVVQFASTPTVAGSTIWHAGNDGTGSTLDADLLDGQQGSYYQNATNLSAGTVAAGRMPALTGDITTSAGAVATTLATVNSNVGAFGNATHVGAFTVNAKGLTTAASAALITPAFASLTATPTTLVGYGITDAVATAAYTAADVLSKLITVDGGASGLDADLLDGQHGSYYENATNLTAGTLASARLPATTGQLTTFSAGLILSGSSGTWTTSSYGKGLVIPKATAIMWPKASQTYAYGISANVDQLNFLSSTADDNSQTVSVMMNANAATSTLTLGLSYFEGGSTNGPRITNGANSTTVPKFSPNRADIGTGVGTGATGQLALIASSTEAVRITSTATTVNTTLAHNGLLPTAGTEIDQIKTVTDSLTLSTSWQDTSVNAADLATGTYIIQVLIDDDSNGGTQNTEYYSGVMSWYSGDTNSTTSDEVVLHRAGISPGGNAIFLRVARTVTADANDMKLQITSTNTDSSASNVTFKFRRMI